MRVRNRLDRAVRWATVPFVLAAVLAGAGCGGGGDDDGGSGSASDEPVVFGVSTVLSGAAARFGQDHLDVVNLYRDTMNARGGIDGHKIVIKVADDRLEPATGVTVTRELIGSQNAAALFGSPGSSVALAELPLLERENVPMCLDYTWADEITEANTDQVFRIGPYNSQIASAYDAYIREKGYKRVAILAEDTDYGIGYANTLKAAAEEDGSYEVDVIQFSARSEDLTPQLSKLAAESPGPDATIIASTSAPQFTFFKQAAEVGLGGAKLSSYDAVTQPDFWPIAGDDGVGVIYPTFFARELQLTPTGRAFKKTYMARYDREPTVYMYLQWDCLEAVRSAIETRRSIDPADIVAALPDLDFEGTTGQVRLTREAGTVHWNQWEDLTTFFKEFTARGQTDSQSRTVYTYKPDAS